MTSSKPKCFISYCNNDKTIMNALLDFLNDIYGCNLPFDSNAPFFCTYEQGATAGRNLDKELNKALDECDVMISIITDSYLRSHICIYEICCFKSSEKPIIPFIFNGNNGKYFLSKMRVSTDVYISFQEDIAKQTTAHKILASLNNKECPKYIVNETCANNKAIAFVEKAQQDIPNRPYIGCDTKFFDDVIQKSTELGIKSIGILNETDFSKYNDCDELYILTTTGNKLIRNNNFPGVIKNILRKNGTVIFLLPNKNSKYCTDIAIIETNSINFDENEIDNNKRRLREEFKGLIEFLCRTKKELQKEEQNGSSISSGKIYIGCSQTILRQTVTIGKKQNQKSNTDMYVGHISLTIPPAQTAVIDGHKITPAIDFEKISDEQSLGNILYYHVTQVKRFAENQGQLYEITVSTDSNDFKSGFPKNKST